MTRLTLDTIALCGFSYRFNSFYRDTQHPFVAAMMSALHERPGPAGRAAGRDQAPPRRPAPAAGRREAHGRQVATILTERKASGEPGTDLLGHMLVGTDKQGNRSPTTTSSRSARPSWSPATRPPAGCCPSRSPTCSRTRRSSPAPRRRSTASWVPTRRCCRPSRSSGSSATSGRSSTRRCGSGRPHPRSPARPRQETTVGGWGPFAPGPVDHRPDPMLHRAPRSGVEDAEEFNPDHFDPETPRRPAAERVQAVRVRVSGPASGASSRMQEAIAGARPCCCSGSSSSTMLYYELKIKEA